MNIKNTKNTKMINAATCFSVWMLCICTPLTGSSAVMRDIAADTFVGSFPVQYIPAPAGAIIAESAVPLEMSVNEISFSIEVTGPSLSALQLQICTGTEEWVLSLEAPVSGESTAYRVSAEFSAGWSVGPDSTESGFENALSQASKVRIYARRSGATSGQNIQIDGFTVSGTVETPAVDELAGDRDGDGIPDGWEIDHGLSTSDASDALNDDDGDTMSNYAEYKAGSDPNDNGSLLAIERVTRSVQAQANGYSIRWQSAPGRTYTIWRTTDLRAGFEKISEAIPSGGDHTTFEDSSAISEQQCFYSIRLDG